MSMRSLPGPKGGWLVGNLREFGRDPLGFLESCARDHGDYVQLRFFHRAVLLVNDAAGIEQVLSTRSRSFRKTLGYRTPFMRRLFGEGLLVSDGAHWTRQRRLAQPAFHRERIAGYADAIIEFTDQVTSSWGAQPSRNVHQDMLRVTTQVVTRTLFNAEVPAEIDDLGSSSKAVMEHFATQWSGWRALLALLPSSRKRRFEEVMQRLDDYIFSLIAERRKSGKDTGDLLSMLLLARDEEGEGMSDRQLRDELTTLMAAGLDTTALALSWGFYLLSRDPEATASLVREVDSVVGARKPGFEDLPRLKYTEAVVKEAMRLYPPAWIVGREALENCDIGGHPVSRGTSVIMSQWVKHRDARHFPDPQRFAPDRWMSAEAAPLPKFAYFPFGGGPRICIGNNFAMMEAMLVTARVIQQFNFRPETTESVKPWASITLQPRTPINLTFAARSPVLSPVF